MVILDWHAFALILIETWIVMFSACSEAWRAFHGSFVLNSDWVGYSLKLLCRRA